jgi:UDP-2,3-diacylglucosamine pyrophosphatase LpxH
MGVVREIYVISDLHLGGEYGEAGVAQDRGFRLCTQVPALTRFVASLTDRPVAAPSIELVVNGDLVDFLAERGGVQSPWRPFLSDQNEAAATFERIVERDAGFFTALTEFLQRGHRLVLLLGNHDIELALPAVRRRLRHALGVTGREDVQFIYDGEAYVVGDALIEHGNRYDKWNMVDNDALRRLRSLQSRQQAVPREHAFVPPAGSRLVSSVMNPIKIDYRFVDLLKPETEAVLPILLALEPGYRSLIASLIPLHAEARRHRLVSDALPRHPGDIASQELEAEMIGDIGAMRYTGWSEDKPPRDLLTATLTDSLGPRTHEFLAGVAEDEVEDFAGDVAMAATVVRTWGLTRLFLSRDRSRIARRMPALLQALRVLQKDRTFDRDVETLPEYQRAAESLASAGFRWVLFGHTHLARDVALSGGARYMNTGTWADVIRFPKDILNGSEPQALQALEAWIADLSAGRLGDWFSQVPTYGRLDIDETGHVAQAKLLQYEG